MELSPEEKRRIYEAEKARLEAQEEARKQLQAKKRKRGCLGCFVLIAVVFVLFTLAVVYGGSISSDYVDLKASVKFDGTDFVITNNDDFDWIGVRLYVNTHYYAYLRTIPANETYYVMARQFAKEDGTRFNPILIKPTHFSIWCDTPEGTAWWFSMFRR